MKNQLKNNESDYHATTIIAVRKNGQTAMAGDGQISLGPTIMKQHAKKVQKLYNNKILVGFAGAAADAIALLERFEEKINKYEGNLRRSAVELAKDWRTDRVLHRLDALLVVADKSNLLVISGTGEIIEPDDGLTAIGSGGPYALAAAKAIMENTSLSAVDIARKSMIIAADICIYTNDNIILETLE